MFKETGKQATKQPNFFFDTCSRRGGPRKRGMETQTSQVAKGEYVCVCVCVCVWGGSIIKYWATFPIIKCYDMVHGMVTLFIHGKSLSNDI